MCIRINKRPVVENIVLSIQSQALVVSHVLRPDSDNIQLAKFVLGNPVPVLSICDRPVEPPLDYRQRVVWLRVAADEDGGRDVAGETGCGVGGDGRRLGFARECDRLYLHSVVWI